MPTKMHPGAFNCYEAALPDEPFFTLLARDPAAPATMQFWMEERLRHQKVMTDEDIQRIEETRGEKQAMVDWREKHLDPTGDGVPAWRLGVRTELDERPVRMEPALGAPYNGEEQKGDPYKTFARSILDIPADDMRWVKEQLGEHCADDSIAVTRMLAAIERGRRSVLTQQEVEDRGCDCSASMAGNSDPHDSTCPMYRAPLIDSAPEDLAHAPEVPYHRFSQFQKGEDYAYARGLEINPTHLPVALDAMRKDGWDLIAIFGATDSKHVGFVFKRIQPLTIDYRPGWFGPDVSKPKRPGSTIWNNPHIDRSGAFVPLDAEGEIIQPQNEPLDPCMTVEVHIAGSLEGCRLDLAKELERLLVGYEGRASFTVHCLIDKMPEAQFQFGHAATPFGGHRVTTKKTLWPCDPPADGCHDYGNSLAV